jgi:phosphoketolase
MISAGEYPHGLSDRDFDDLCAVDKPIIFNFHGPEMHDWVWPLCTYSLLGGRSLAWGLFAALYPENGT